MDVTMQVDFLPARGSVGVNKMVENFGGTAGNFAMVAQRLGVPFDLYSAISSRTHSAYISFLSGIGVDLSHLVVDREDLGPIGYAVTTGKDQIYYFYQGPMEHPLYEKLNLRSLDYSFVHFGTGLPSDFIKLSKLAPNSRIVFDPGQEISYRYRKEDLDPMLRMSYIAILNEVEEEKAASLMGIETPGLQGLCTHLIVTRGSAGSSYYHGGERRDFGALKVENPYDTIGAGDAFRAGMYLALEQGMSMEDSIVMGTIVSSEAIKKPFKDYSGNRGDVMEIFEKERDNIIL